MNVGVVGLTGSFPHVGKTLALFGCPSAPCSDAQATGAALFASHVRPAGTYGARLLASGLFKNGKTRCERSRNLVRRKSCRTRQAAAQASGSPTVAVKAKQVELSPVETLLKQVTSPLVFWRPFPLR